jgi:hypothetical protein
MKTVMGFAPPAQVEIVAQFQAMQAYLVSLYNGIGESVLIRRPTPEQFANVKLSHQLEALVRTCTRPIPSRAVHSKKKAAAA